MAFIDRLDAGRQLAARLSNFASDVEIEPIDAHHPQSGVAARAVHRMWTGRLAMLGHARCVMVPHA